MVVFDPVDSHWRAHENREISVSDRYAQVWRSVPHEPIMQHWQHYFVSFHPIIHIVLVWASDMDETLVSRVNRHIDMPPSTVVLKDILDSACLLIGIRDASVRIVEVYHITVSLSRK